MNTINIVLRDQNCLPIKGYQDDAGYDLKSMVQCDINPNSQMLIDTGINISLPKQEQWIWQAQIRPRSGLSAKKQINVTNSPGTIDNSYNGDIKVILRNNGNQVFHVNKYDRIAQLVITKIPKTKLVVVDNLNATTRGNSGFGSTGI